MPLDLVTRSFSKGGGTTAIDRFNIDMPIVPNKLCLIRQVQVLNVDWGNTALFDQTFGMSLDPDHVPASLVAADSRMFILARYVRIQLTAEGFQSVEGNPKIFHFAEGMQCPYGRLPFFVQNSNNNAAVTDYRIAVFFTLERVSPQELAVAVMRRGRGETRRVP